MTADNILYDEKEKKIKFIDLEYCGLNYRGFDIGNHFCEWAGLKCEWEYYPSRKEQMNFIKAYLSGYKGVPIDQENEEVEELFVEANQFALVSHLMWGLWGIAMQEARLEEKIKEKRKKKGKEEDGEEEDDDEDEDEVEQKKVTFDYVRYAKHRLSEYQNRKTEFLALSAKDNVKQSSHRKNNL